MFRVFIAVVPGFPSPNYATMQLYVHSLDMERILPLYQLVLYQLVLYQLLLYQLVLYQLVHPELGQLI